jgi:hypothetical protein
MKLIEKNRWRIAPIHPAYRRRRFSIGTPLRNRNSAQQELARAKSDESTKLVILFPKKRRMRPQTGPNRCAPNAAAKTLLELNCGRGKSHGRKELCTPPPDRAATGPPVSQCLRNSGLKVKTTLIGRAKKARKRPLWRSWGTSEWIRNVGEFRCKPRVKWLCVAVSAQITLQKFTIILTILLRSKGARAMMASEFLRCRSSRQIVVDREVNAVGIRLNGPFEICSAW